MVQPKAAVNTTAITSTSTMARGSQLMPSSPSAVKAMMETKAPIMYTSPCAKLIMPTMP